MSEKEKVNTVAIDEMDDEQEVQDNSGNKVVVRALFLSAQHSERSKKIGITILLFESMDEKGQVRVALDQRTAGKTSYTISPVITTWFDPDPKKTEPDVLEKMKAFLNKGGLCTVYAVVSGNGEFRRIHNFLSDAEYKMYMNLVK